MQILVLRHEPFEHLGHFAAVLEENRVEYRYHELGDPLPREPYSGLIIMGGPMSANDDLPGLRDELRFIEKALGEGLPLLGICLGSQLIARALGARVYRNNELEIGWERVWFTEAARDDALFGGRTSPETFFHWHGDTFDLPSGALRLAYSDKCQQQAYRYGSKTYGIQFHPEITAEMIADWCLQPVNCGDVAMAGPIDPLLHDGQEASRKIVESWLKLF
jgi:GMP synthase (glutamine-hydrolysing)